MRMTATMDMLMVLSGPNYSPDVLSFGQLDKVTVFFE
jgi:hypothetical protein